VTVLAVNMSTRRLLLGRSVKYQQSLCCDLTSNVRILTSERCRTKLPQLHLFSK
jgi:hypothetical protein